MAWYIHMLQSSGLGNASSLLLYMDQKSRYPVARLAQICDVQLSSMTVSIEVHPKLHLGSEIGTSTPLLPR